MTHIIEYKIQKETFTIDQLEAALVDKKPYILEIEKAVKDVDYGTIDCKLEVRAGAVEKIAFFSTRNWLRQKPNNLQSKP